MVDCPLEKQCRCSTSPAAYTLRISLTQPTIRDAQRAVSQEYRSLTAQLNQSPAVDPRNNAIQTHSPETVKEFAYAKVLEGVRVRDYLESLVPFVFLECPINRGVWVTTRTACSRYLPVLASAFKPRQGKDFPPRGIAKCFNFTPGSAANDSDHLILKTKEAEQWITEAITFVVRGYVEIPPRQRHKVTTEFHPFLSLLNVPIPAVCNRCSRHVWPCWRSADGVCKLCSPHLPLVALNDNDKPGELNGSISRESTSFLSDLLSSPVDDSILPIGDTMEKLLSRFWSDVPSKPDSKGLEGIRSSLATLRNVSISAANIDTDFPSPTGSSLSTRGLLSSRGASPSSRADQWNGFIEAGSAPTTNPESGVLEKNGTPDTGFLNFSTEEHRNSLLSSWSPQACKERWSTTPGALTDPNGFPSRLHRRYSEYGWYLGDSYWRFPHSREKSRIETVHNSSSCPYPEKHLSVTESLRIDSPTAANSTGEEPCSKGVIESDEDVGSVLEEVWRLNEEERLDGEEGSMTNSSQTDELGRSRFVHTRWCPQFKKSSTCDRGDMCKFAHSWDTLKYTEDVYKTKICEFWRQGHCKAGTKCRHAHGEAELRPKQLKEGEFPGTEFGHRRQQGRPKRAGALALLTLSPENST